LTALTALGLGLALGAGLSSSSSSDNSDSSDSVRSLRSDNGDAFLPEAEAFRGGEANVVLSTFTAEGDADNDRLRFVEDRVGVDIDGSEAATDAGAEAESSTVPLARDPLLGVAGVLAGECGVDFAALGELEGVRLPLLP
jgi:hypothetical protein